MWGSSLALDPCVGEESYVCWTCLCIASYSKSMCSRWPIISSFVTIPVMGGSSSLGDADDDDDAKSLRASNGWISC